MIKVSASYLLPLLLAGVVVSLPQYSYQPPATPTGLYTTPTQAPVRRPLPPPPPPTSLYTAPQATQLRPQARPSPGPAMEGMPYDFQYGVQDPESGNAFSHVENSDGRTTQGEYRVLLPDGRTQVVTFYDNGGGFNADVTYV
ncbi:pro-resilin-like [Eriocheir sinensis]|uniref:pro-resilin-like n=1 Tax=Eriocheir sinensis TaxID=95602 RepID=UPI0021C6CA4B|nr:pro-resilin-like [Eriocheir sinensis]